MINTYIIAEFSLIQDSLQESFNTKGLKNFGHSPTTSSLSEHENICMGISLPQCKQVDYDQHYKRKELFFLILTIGL